ncbi:MAG TPA: efflux RND transporter periplasmic adaptor subunit [Planctomycetota bacterium]|nr:efflux RND transporter periplasmic adaptor subunit [Planctomycetota bacterium]
MKTLLARSFLMIVPLFAMGCEKDPRDPGKSVAPAHGSGPEAPAVPAVVVAKVVSQKLSKSLRLPGELWAYRNVALFAKVQGFVENIGVDRGSEVKQGELLAQLTAPEFEAQRVEAEARLTSNLATYKRLEEAAKTPGVVAGNDVEIAQKQVDADRARIRVYAQNVAYLRITAPFSGVITERNVHEGSIVGPSSAQPLLRIQEIARLRLVVYVPESAVGGIQVGEKFQFTVPAYPGELFPGTVARLAYALDPKMRTMPVELDVENADRRLTPSMVAEVLWHVTRPAPSLFVPGSAVVTTTERRFVIRVKEGETEWVDVRVGQPVGNLMEVFGNLSAGDLIAQRGSDELRSGTRVTAKEAPAASR